MSDMRTDIEARSVERGERGVSGVMRAATVDRYGPPEVVHIADVALPRPAEGEVLVRVHAAAVTSGDARIRGARFPAGFGPFVRLVFGITRPRRRILGNTFAGVVEATGGKVGGIAPGEAVCGMTGTKLGTHAQFVTARADRVARVPTGVSLDDAVGVLFGGTTALHFLRDKASVTAGDTVLVNGASGAVGSNAVQLAKHLGATVTAVVSGANAELVTALGADHVLDHQRDDLAAIDARFDVVLDCVGNLTVGSGRRLLAEDGVLVLLVAGLWDNIRARKHVVAGSAPERVQDMDFLLDLLANGELTVVHDSSYDLDHIADAYRRVDSGHKRGNVVVHPWPDDEHPTPVPNVESGRTAASHQRPPRLPPAWFKHAFWRGHRAAYRLSGGRFLWTPASKRGWGAMHLTTTGRKTGKQRGVIIAYLEDGPNVTGLAMNGWDEGHPAWWRNLEAHPEAIIRLPRQQPRRVRARLATGDERQRLWDRWLAIEPEDEAFAVGRRVETPIVVFEPID